MDERILQLIGDTPFERDLYEAAMFNLEDQRNKLRFHNFAFAMRELVGHTLARLAPDEEVMKCIWWKKKANPVTPQVTRIERCVYATQGGLSNHYVKTKLGLDFSKEFEELRDAVVRLNGYVHITQEVFQLENEEIARLAKETIEAVSRLMICIQDCRAAIGVRLSEEAINSAAVEQVVGDSLEAIDEIASHYSLEKIYINSHEVIGITSEAVHISVSGSLGVTLQWGSNSDMRRGDGAELNQSFDFTCELTCELTCAAPNLDPDALYFVENSVRVDTGDWHDHEEEWSSHVSDAAEGDAVDLASDF
ncbi:MULTISPECIES: pPIWI-associating nuclease domain-containing protein [Pseudomonas]|uniref:Uncharacterized protein n=1 Tax=Pseudomonas lutea TaxID=243924 RepID=A0A9X8MHD2_9PSED|nr:MULTISPECIES: hypothetical protein [Pseudomonas]SER40735.1 hypothetical protein SAMN05216409_11974 [Pseudomonas lutea]